MKKRVRTAMSDLQLCEEDISLKQQQQSQVQQALEEQQQRFIDLRSSLDSLGSKTKRLRSQRMHNLEDIVDAQSLLKHYQAVSKGQMKLRYDVSYCLFIIIKNKTKKTHYLVYDLYVQKIDSAHLFLFYFLFCRFILCSSFISAAYVLFLCD